MSIRKLIFLIVSATLLLPVIVMAQTGGTTTRVSISSAATQANGSSRHARISGNGRYVVFQSTADNLTSGDTNGNTDIFRHDRETGTTDLISLDLNGTPANGHSTEARISADGCIITFQSTATDLVPNDTNGSVDIFAFDCQTNTIERITVNNSGVEAAQGGSSSSVSDDGRFVAYRSTSTNLVDNDTNDESDIFLFDRTLNTVQLISVANDGTQANWSSFRPVVSADGSFVAFDSLAWNLVPNDTNFQMDVFVYDVASSTIERVSVDSAENQGSGQNDPKGGGFNGAAYVSISADARYIAFSAEFNNLVPNDTNTATDVFIRDRTLGTTARVSVSSNGTQANDDARFDTAISNDGRYIAFVSEANNLVADDLNTAWDVFRHDTQTATTERLSINSAGIEANGLSTKLSLAASGATVAFNSGATNLVDRDTNAVDDVFVHDLNTTPTAVNLTSQSTQLPSLLTLIMLFLLAAATFTLRQSHSTIK